MSRAVDVACCIQRDREATKHRSNDCSFLCPLDVVDVVEDVSSGRTRNSAKNRVGVGFFVYLVDVVRRLVNNAQPGRSCFLQSAAAHVVFPVSERPGSRNLAALRQAWK